MRWRFTATSAKCDLPEEKSDGTHSGSQPIHGVVRKWNQGGIPAAHQYSLGKRQVKITAPSSTRI
jgi:hypothetical protein